MNLLIASGAYPPMAFGEAPNTYHLASHLAKLGHSVTVLTRKIDSPRVPDGFRLRAVMKDWTWKRVPQLRSLLKEVQPEAILQLHLGAIYDLHPMMTFFPTIAKDVLPGVRFVTRFENPLSESEPERMPFAARAYHKLFAHRCGKARVHRSSGTLLRDSDAVISLCGYHFHILRAHDPMVESIVIPPPANVEVVPDPDGNLRRQGRRRLGIEPGCFVLGYLGYVYQDKGVEVLLHALAQLRAKGRQFRLVVLGGPVAPAWPGDQRGPQYYESMQKLAQVLGLQPEIVWMGPFSRGREIADLVHSVDAFVLPFDDGAHLNNSSIATLTSYGAALITTRKHTDPQFVDGENMLLCPPKDPASICAAIESLMDDDAARQSLRVGALRLATEWFSWSKAMQLTLGALGAHATEPDPLSITSALLASR
jgi:polysaccharide biosynthesis protein PslF